MSLADSSGFLHIVHRLILAKASDAPADVQIDVGIGRSNFYRVLRFFKFHGAATYDRGSISVDKKKALTLAAGLRADRAVPYTVIESGPSLDQTIRLLQSERIPFVLAFQSAANHHGYFEPSGATSIYVDLVDRRRAARLLNQKDNHPVHIHAERLERLPAENMAPGARITTPVQTLLDLLVTPGAGAHAAFLQEVLARRGIL